jgi:hypothetical protein
MGEKMVKLLGKTDKLLITIGSAGVFDGCCSHNDLKELTLQDDLESVMGILSVVICGLIDLSLIFIIRDIALGGRLLGIKGLIGISIHFIKLHLIF